MDVHVKSASTSGTTIHIDSSSSPPSSPPLSPEPDDIDTTSPPHLKQNGTDRSYTAPSLVFGGTTSVQARPSAKEKGGSEQAPRKKPGRKKKEETSASASASASASGSTTLGDKPVKEKKTRKPRDPNAPPAKRRKIGDDSSTAPATATATATGRGAQLQPNNVHSLAATTGSAQPPSQQRTAYVNNNHSAPAPPAFAQIGKTEAEYKQSATATTTTPATATATVPQYGALQPPSRPSTSSGQRYDPIRSASAENALLRNSAPPTRPTVLSSMPNARASPSIASLIDPPSIYAPSHHSSTVAQITSPANTRLPPPPSPLTLGTLPLAPSPSVTTASNLTRSTHDSLAAVIQPADPQAEVGAKPIKATAAQKPVKSETQSKANSPKPTRQKQASPPIPLGSGLLSNSTFGKSEPTSRQYAEVPNQCIVIEVPMTQETGNYVNFIREVENKYGFDVAHPRLAEHRRRMAQMAAAGAAIEADLGQVDEMPLDESEIDSNVEMGGVDDDSTAQEGMKKKKRKPRANEYDKNDGFIDDTEQLWEEQAMASSNGFFVWSGPLVPEIEKPVDDKAVGTVSKRGRGRGRGGSTRGETSGRGRGAGSGRGSRGGATAKVRKPRITNAEKLKLESEQQEREKMATAVSKVTLASPVEG